MKKINIIILCLGVSMVIFGCKYRIAKDEDVQNISKPINDTSEIKINNNLPNIFREPKLLFQINYPQNWVITNYVNNGREEVASLLIASHPMSSEGWAIDNPPPSSYMGFRMVIRSHGSIYIDNIKNEKNVIQREKNEINIPGGSQLTIITYDYKNQSEVQDLGLPTVAAYYYGDNYLYEFDMPRNGPSSEKEIDMFKEIVSSFIEIK